jgi:hypothetical protein
VLKDGVEALAEVRVSTAAIDVGINRLPNGLIDRDLVNLGHFPQGLGLLLTKPHGQILDRFPFTHVFSFLGS